MGTNFYLKEFTLHKGKWVYNDRFNIGKRVGLSQGMKFVYNYPPISGISLINIVSKNKKFKYYLFDEYGKRVSLSKFLKERKKDTQIEFCHSGFC